MSLLNTPVSEILYDVSDIFSDPKRIPKKQGVYFWLARKETLLKIQSTLEPTPKFEMRISECSEFLYNREVYSLIYVGIARAKNTLNKRIFRQHLNGNINASTFRKSIGALLKTFDKKEILAWQKEHLLVGYMPHNCPEQVENAFIEKCVLPFNLKGNHKDYLFTKYREGGLPQLRRDIVAKREQMPKQERGVGN